MMLNFHTNQFVTAAEIKTKLTKIYEGMGITKPAAATDISQWYDVRAKSKRNKKTGIMERGFEIMYCTIKALSHDEVKTRNAIADLVDTFTIDASSPMSNN